VEPECAGPPKKANSVISRINIPVK